MRISIGWFIKDQTLHNYQLRAAIKDNKYFSIFIILNIYFGLHLN